MQFLVFTCGTVHFLGLPFSGVTGAAAAGGGGGMATGVAGGCGCGTAADSGGCAGCSIGLTRSSPDESTLVFFLRGDPPPLPSPPLSLCCSMLLLVVPGGRPGPRFRSGCWDRGSLRLSDWRRLRRMLPANKEREKK